MDRSADRNLGIWRRSRCTEIENTKMFKFVFPNAGNIYRKKRFLSRYEQREEGKTEGEGQ